MNDSLIGAMSVMILSIFLLASAAVGYNCPSLDKPKQTYFMTTGIIALVGLMLSMFIMYLGTGAPA